MTVHAVHAVTALAGPVVQARAWRRHAVRERAGAAAMAALAADGRCPQPESWVLLPTVGDTAVVRVTTAQDGDLIVKVALSAAASAGLARHAYVVNRLGRTDALRSAVPGLMTVGDLGQHRYVVERAAPGAPLTGDLGPGATAGALQLMGVVHTMTAHVPTRGDGTVSAGLDADLARLGRVCRSEPRRRTLDRLRHALDGAHDGHPFVAAVVHGDFWPGNVLALGEGGDRQATAIVDWERAAMTGVPEVDLVHYLLDIHPDGFAAAVRASLAAPETTVGEWLATFGVSTLNPQLGRTWCTVLAWLGHVGAGLEATRRFGAGPLWVRTEVGTVLDFLGAHDGLLAGLSDGNG